MNSEIRNYFRRCIVPSFAFLAVVIFCKRAFWALLRRVAPGYRILSQPKSISRTRRKLLAITPSKINLVSPGNITPGRIRLSIGWFDFTDKPDWSTTFSDPEITFSLHRWNWLLRGLTDDSEKITREQGLALMRSWLCYCLHQERFGTNAYSTAERIVNGSLFLLKTGEGVVPSDIQVAFHHMGRQIAAHLEYYEGNLTGNHAFNNARGLLFAGIVASLPGAVELALAISMERLPQLVTKDGFLREGSSHYHFLFTRWVLEMYWIAKRDKRSEIIRLLESYARMLVERCWFFLLKEYSSDQWQIPLVGDVSPDFPPDWLLALPWSKLANEVYSPVSLSKPPSQAGWASIFGLVNSTDCNVKTKALTFPESFWHQIEYGKLTLFVYASAEPGKLMATHQHNDLGGFALYMEGSPILVDCGRLDYTNSLLSSYGKEGWGHNTLFINNLPPTAEGPSWLQKGYRVVDVNTSFSQSADLTSFLIEHNGFSRLAGGNIIHKRRLTLKLDSFIVEDQITGSGTYNVLLRFHWAPGFDLSPDGELLWHGNPIELTFIHDEKFQVKKLVVHKNDHPAGFYFPEYGVQQACMTIEMNGLVKLPLTIRNQIILKN